MRPEKDLLIVGDGGHAQDIRATLERFYKQVDHHKNIRPFSHAGDVLLAINDPHVRAAVAEELGVEDERWVHPSAFIGPDCEIGTGTHVNYMASMTRTRIGRHCTIAPGVTICGDVTIGDRVFIGAGAVIRNLVTIGDDAFIRMGSIVTRDVAPGERY
jgi:acetyltransferase-like isoleucine patch superfamily enzyme